MPYDPEQWHDFATSFAGAAGALLGLAFVAISFNLEFDPAGQDAARPGDRNPGLLCLSPGREPSHPAARPVQDGPRHRPRPSLPPGIVALAAAIDVPRWQQERHNPLSWRLGHIAPAVVIALLTIRRRRSHHNGQLRWPVLAGRRHGRRHRLRAHQQLGLARRDQALIHSAPRSVPGCLQRPAQPAKTAWLGSLALRRSNRANAAGRGISCGSRSPLACAEGYGYPVGPVFA